MCEHCNDEVATVGEHLDRWIAAEKMLRQTAGLKDETSQQHTMRMAAIALEAYSDEDDKCEAIYQMAMGLACAVSRLVAAQEIYGITL